MSEIVDKFIADRFGITDGNSGQPVNPGNIGDTREFARELGYFLYQLHRLPAGEENSAPSFENNFAGSDLSFFESEFSMLLKQYQKIVPADLLQEKFERAANKPWGKDLVWVLGDFVPQNLRVTNGKLVDVVSADRAVIGDPACDLAVAWAIFDEKARKIFFSAAEADAATIERARIFALCWALKNYQSEDIDALIQSRDATTEILKDFNYSEQQDLY
ncbi:phosphotransferase [Lactococcus protaetiae]|uniref:Phosphotransferase n=1 Tax=Lactococcus protaetiae TaxID=2592653 RepID=A0A514Z6E2_9LACT|nr:phosphotransferase [Lactococcus protaetiae]QDK70123.1 phosphotransferase [Lactococcus protaetiae]